MEWRYPSLCNLARILFDRRESKEESPQRRDWLQYVGLGFGCPGPSAHIRMGTRVPMADPIETVPHREARRDPPPGYELTEAAARGAHPLACRHPMQCR